MAYYNVATIIILQNNVVDSNYSMLMGRLWLRDAKVTHDWGNNVITVQGNGTVRTILINKKLGVETKRPQVLVCYDFMEGLIDEEENMIFEIELELFSIGTITISDEIVSLLSVESKLKQRISNKKAIELMASIRKTIEFNVRQEISLEDKVYKETYYHHSQVDIEMDETPIKIQVQNL
jgi:hypothetical protein